MHPHRSRGSGVPQLPGKEWSRTQQRGGTISILVCLTSFRCVFLTAPPSRLIVVLGYRRGVDRGGGSRLTHPVIALHPTDSHCAESSVPCDSLCGTGFLVRSFWPYSCSVSALFCFSAAKDFFGSQTVRPPGAGNRPLRDVRRGLNTPVNNMFY